MKLSRLYIFLFSLLFSLYACIDDEIYSPDDVGEGITDVTATVSFQSFVPSLATRGEKGDIIHDINNMMVLIYDGNADDTKSKLLRTEYFTKDDTQNWILNQNGNNSQPGDIDKNHYDGEKDNPHSTGETTPSASFKIKNLNYGKYHIYVVANMGELSGDQIETPYALKHIALTWNNVDIAANNQMFGYFTLDNDTDRASEGFAAPLVTVKAGEVSLHAWIKRAASKVTIAFDTSKLKERVRIYIHKVTIYDVPKTCILGANNKPESTDGLWPNNDNPQVIYYGEGDDFHNWMLLVHDINGDNRYGSDHSNDSEALFFYENMQGDFQGQEKYNKVMSDEVQFGDNPIRNPGEPDYKDEVEYGTYIEVEGYYDAATLNTGRPTKGEIKYRFMLGKNTTYNYDAQRNHHYKLTLRLNGYANEADWHIDYVDEKPELYVPEYYYVSYLYGQGIGEGMPVRLAGNAKSLTAEIIENNWAPYDESTKSVPASQHPSGDFYWNRQAYIDLDKAYNDNSYRGHCNFVGFLSLRKTTETTVNPGQLDGNGYGPNTMEYLKNFYLNRKQWYVGPVDGVPTNEPGYDLTPTEPGKYHTIGSVANNDYLEYTVKKDEDGSVTVMVPMWTRAKSLGPMTGFSGNNPFVNYMRKAVVRFTATFVLNNGKTDTKTKDVPVFQVRRVVNPKAIWRSRGDDSEFNVTLTNLLTPDATSFSEFKSEGKWRVSVEKTLDESGNSDWVELSLPSGTKPDENGYIYGSDNTPIKFKYKPSGTTSKDRFGIIKVEYNDYTCVHQIYVRQGYDEDIKISESSNTLWSSKNVYAFVSQTGSATTSGTNATSGLSSISAIATESPLSIGTYFKRGNYDYGILESNNNTYGWNVSVEGRNLSTVHYTSATNKATRNAVWGNIWGVTNDVEDWKWARQIKVGSTNYRVPSYDDYNALLNRDVDFGYGVVYGDGSEDTQFPLANAYSFMDANNNGATAAMRKNGVRCCIVYNGSTGHQVLFPLSASGYGRRNCRPMTANANNNGWTFVASNRGKLIYSGVIELLTNNLGSNNWYRPLNYNLLRNAGATYWINERRAGGHISDGDASYAWDMNYFSYDFGGYDSSSLGGTTDAARSSDALPIKLVR